MLPGERGISVEDFKIPQVNPFLVMSDESLQENRESWMQERLRPEITPLGLKGYFNPAVIEMNDGTIALLARHVEKAAEYGMPDTGSLVKIILEHDGSRYQVLAIEQIWNPEDSPGALLEDIRALKGPKGKDKRVVLGATVVMDDTVVDMYGHTKVEKAPYGAIAILDDETQIPDAPKRFRYCRELGRGKNMTATDMEGNFLFREEGKDDDHNFILSIIHYDQATDTVTKTGELDFRAHMRGKKWGGWRIGTTAVLATDDSTQALVLHGISIDKVPTTQNPYGVFFRYSFGLACCERLANGTWNIVGVDPQPMTVPDDFSNESARLGEQLHPELRDAIYLCGISQRTNKDGEKFVDTLASYGDTEIFLASFPVEAVLKRMEQIYESQRLREAPIAV